MTAFSVRSSSDLGFIRASPICARLKRHKCRAPYDASSCNQWPCHAFLPATSGAGPRTVKVGWRRKLAGRRGVGLSASIQHEPGLTGVKLSVSPNAGFLVAGFPNSFVPDSNPMRAISTPRAPACLDRTFPGQATIWAGDDFQCWFFKTFSHEPGGDRKGAGLVEHDELVLTFQLSPIGRTGGMDFSCRPSGGS